MAARARGARRPPNCQISASDWCQIGVAKRWQGDNIPNCVNGPCSKEERPLSCDQSGRREERNCLCRKPRASSRKMNILQDFTEENVYANEAAQLRRADEQQ